MDIVTDNPHALSAVDNHPLTGYYMEGCCVQVRHLSKSKRFPYLISTCTKKKLAGMLTKIVNASTGQIEKTGVYRDAP